MKNKMNSLKPGTISRLTETHRLLDPKINTEVSLTVDSESENLSDKKKRAMTNFATTGFGFK